VRIHIQIGGSVDYNHLAQALECCKGSKDGTTSITYKILGNDSVELCYTCVVNFASEASFRSQQSRELDRAKEMIKDATKIVKKEFKSLTREELQMKVVQGSESDSIEIISATAHNPRRIAYYRFRTVFAVK
jgi:hypothetical protein